MIERTDARLILAETHIGPVATEDVRLRHWQGTGLTGISKDELAGLDRPSLAGQRVDAAAFDRWLIDAVFVAERIEVAWLRAEVLGRHNADAREVLVLLAGDCEGSLLLFFGIAECAYADMDLTFTVRFVPIFRIVDAVVAELPGARCHAVAERLGEALQ